jgi:hypothetical protein
MARIVVPTENKRSGQISVQKHRESTIARFLLAHTTSLSRFLVGATRISKPHAEQDTHLSLLVPLKQFYGCPSSVSLLQRHGVIEESGVFALGSIERRFLLDLGLLGRSLGDGLVFVVVIVTVVGGLLYRAEIRLVESLRSRQCIEHTAALLGRSGGGLLGSLRSLRSLRGLRGRCGGLAGEIGSELLPTVLHRTELVLERRRRAVSVKRGHEFVGLGAQGGALGVQDCENAGHGLKAEGLHLGFLLWRHGARCVVGVVMRGCWW